MGDGALTQVLCAGVYQLRALAGRSQFVGHGDKEDAQTIARIGSMLV